MSDSSAFYKLVSKGYEAYYSLSHSNNSVACWRISYPNFASPNRNLYRFDKVLTMEQIELLLAYLDMPTDKLLYHMDDELAIHVLRERDRNG